MTRRLLTSILSVAAVALVGCGTHATHENADPPSDIQPGLDRFSSCGDLRGYVADAWLEELIRSRYSEWAMYDAEAGDAGDDGGNAGPTDYSTTNVQEAGVDEPDIEKTDGNYIYVVQPAPYYDGYGDGAGQLTIVQSWPAEDTAVVGSVAVDGYPYSMFLSGDRAAVFSYVWSSDGGAPWRDGYATRVSIVDLTDRANPQVVREIDLEGWMADARMIDDDVYVVLNTWQWMPNDVWNLVWDDSLGLPAPDFSAPEEQQEQIREEAREMLRPYVEDAANAADIDDLLPQVYDHAPGAFGDGANLLDCSDVYHPDGVSTPTVLTVAHVALNDGDQGGDVSATGLMADGWTVYASQDNLYVAETSWYWWWGWGDLDLKTHIHQFSLDGGEPRYEASGAVDGWLLNQFSMSEYDGRLRVATTDFDWWWGSGMGDEQQGNSVFVLEKDGSELSTVGEITGIAPGEQITAARFLGTKGYLTTYQWTDPLFTLDLSDPTKPEVKGELELPGYNSYLHPVDDDHLLSVGMDAGSSGEVTGFSVSLFDVSDLTKPSLVDRQTVSSSDWSWSESLWDHHAFTFHDGVVAVPLYTWDWDAKTGDYEGFSGMWEVGVAADGLSDVGRVDHRDLVDESRCLYYADGESCPSDYWYAWMRRSVVIEGNLYSISDYGMKVTNLTDPTDVKASVVWYPAAK